VVVMSAIVHFEIHFDEVVKELVQSFNMEEDGK
jgi:hypothetical protein